MPAYTEGIALAAALAIAAGGVIGFGAHCEVKYVYVVSAVEKLRADRGCGFLATSV